MKRTHILGALTVLFGVAMLTANVHADGEGHTFVYTNNNNLSAPNSVSAFSVGPGGILLPVAGSPFTTGGTGSGNGFFASHHITATVTRNFLFAANDGSNDVSVFQIDTGTGALTLVTGSPFATGGSGSISGISLAATPNGRFLYAGNADSNNITVFRIASNGALTRIGSPTPAGGTPDGIKVTPNGKFLGVALPSSDSVAMFSISSSGALMPVPGSPFAAGGSGLAADVEINCTSSVLFDPKETAAAGTEVSVFRIASNGALAQIEGSPFTFIPGSDSNVGVLSPDNQHLFVSNQFSNQITSLDVASGGILVQENGSPFANPGGMTPNGMGTNREGTLLYVANFGDNTVTGFQIQGDGGSLTPVTGSPFPTGAADIGLESLTVFPAHEEEGEGHEEDSNGHKGHFRFEGDRKCAARGEMEFDDDHGDAMNGSMDSYNVVGNTATITGSGILADGTPVQYTVVATGNQLVPGANIFSISWITPTGAIFQTLGGLIDGFIAVH